MKEKSGVCVCFTMIATASVYRFPFSSPSYCWCLVSENFTFSSSVIGVSNTSKRRISTPNNKFCVQMKATAESDSAGDSRWVQFPRLSGASLLLMTDMAESFEKELGSLLNPTQTPSDVRYFKSSEGNAEGSITIRSGRDGSNMDFVLGSWLSCKLPFGSLHISTLIAMLRPHTDAPHLLFEFIQNAPDSLILVFDLLPRKDLVLHPQYLHRYYEDTELEAIRKQIESAPESEAYVSSSLYIRSLVSPTALLFKIKAADESGMERVISERLHPAVKTEFGIWLHGLKAKAWQESHEMAMAMAMAMARRDEEIVRNGVEVDLSTNMAKLFGQTIADRAIAAFRRRE